ncbi:DUF1330 domain-containing protein [Sulfitobacter pseudonitzschiae]|uniref:DUF1330 domain-containing protein n=1 Tax=Pseudosulfitobacter pseudonitzschiae TaxID=1402135 RepID=A0A9Q2RWQ6_9RHOB|nr:DUF1330 domain-containing protein [Pseudosulfitobacter pseudonitzschiae]MBM2292890.1 DUF1330 domain-containing protein [Pseudosulfitobacter pseudonitzschiae]MBM2298582.1 DUF1330 domain-containing protein [Pseudosulfitobacter pseudonitzschiae]MBM2303496.1 DUF1330 domain-containing protein [Pseudosulfitobacter pseudonitzschiae]MBM2313279.1 DUF1330 domain-containing protein [Pseudosulfitobacter pseudonitzschiae]MBM2318192.1 DUF1330 domain-containing protein [Pseudosulfitobacter pseudonitzschia
MTCYAVGHLRNIAMGPDIVAYLERIDATLAPFRGQFIIHGGEKHMLEGQFRGDLIVIAFPDHEHAEGWYASRDYKALLSLRTDHSEGEVFLIQGVDASHKALDVLGADADRA